MRRYTVIELLKGKGGGKGEELGSKCHPTVVKKCPKVQHPCPGKSNNPLPRDTRSIALKFMDSPWSIEILNLIRIITIFTNIKNLLKQNHSPYWTTEHYYLSFKGLFIQMSIPPSQKAAKPTMRLWTKAGLCSEACSPPSGSCCLCNSLTIGWDWHFHPYVEKGKKVIISRSLLNHFENVKYIQFNNSPGK